MNKKTVLTFLFAAVFSVALAGCAAGGGAAGASSAAPDSSAAADAGAATQSTDAANAATLQIVNVDASGAPVVMLNKYYAFEDGAVIANLFDAAVEAGDLKSYELNEFGFIQSFTFADGTTVANADDFSTYWAQYENATYYAGSETLLTEKLAAGTAYQFGMEAYEAGKESVPTDWAALGAPEAGTATAVTDLAAAA